LAVSLPPSINIQEDKSKFMRDLLDTRTPQRALVEQLANDHIDVEAANDELLALAAGDSGTATFTLAEEMTLKVIITPTLSLSLASLSSIFNADNGQNAETAWKAQIIGVSEATSSFFSQLWTATAVLCDQFLPASYSL
jgi:hypothetical protein